MAARLLKDKGIYEFVEASKVLARRGVAVTFRVLGDVDPHNSSSVTAADLEHWKKTTGVEFLGYREEISEQYAQAHIVCLPRIGKACRNRFLRGLPAAGRLLLRTFLAAEMR